MEDQGLLTGAMDGEGEKGDISLPNIAVYIAERSRSVSESIKSSISVALRRATWLHGRRVPLGLIMLTLCGMIFASTRMKPVELEKQSEGKPDQALLAWEAAGNRTLGFHSIKYINLEKRFDRRDAAILQAYLSGLDLEDYPGVEQSMISDQGMPPTSSSSLKIGEKACFRAHANIWGDILRKRLPPVLILESDATWDVYVRPAMAIFNRYFTEYLKMTGARPLYRSDPPPESSDEDPNSSTRGLGSKARRRLNDQGQSGVPSDQASQIERAGPSPLDEPLIEPDPDDPWHSDYWDILSFGDCFDAPKRDNPQFLTYPDPYAPVPSSFFGYDLGSERIITESGAFVCLTGYAVTQRAAAKMLLRMATDLSEPVDNIIRNMQVDGDLKVYSVNSAFFAQWVYMDGLGMIGRGSISDIHGTSIEHVVEGESPDMSGWDKAREAKTVWKIKPTHADSALKFGALRVAWDYIFSTEKDITADM